MQFIDSHSHIDFSEFNNDRKFIIESANNAGVTDIIVSSTTADRWVNVKKLCEESLTFKTNCHPAYGLHPMFMGEHATHHLDDLKQLLENAIAIGEIGLDFFISEANESDNKVSQLAFFISQLELANEFKLPVIVHARKSLDIVLKHLRQFPNVVGSIHSFSGSEQQAKQLIDLGFYLGFGGPVTYTRATKLRKLVMTLPLESILLETDSPDQPDALHYKERNEPAYLVNVAQVVAELRQVDINVIAQTTTANAKRLFTL